MHTFLAYIIDSQYIYVFSSNTFSSKRWTVNFVTISIFFINIYTKIFIIFLKMNNLFIRDWKLDSLKIQSNSVIYNYFVIFSREYFFCFAVVKVAHSWQKSKNVSFLYDYKCISGSYTLRSLYVSASRNVFELDYSNFKIIEILYCPTRVFFLETHCSMLINYLLPYLVRR